MEFDEGERSESGQPIHRYGPREKSFEPAIGNETTLEEIDRHITEFVGPVKTVYHEIVSDLVHIDVHFVEATDERPFHTLITTGMSDRPMKAPEAVADCRFAELMLCLPAGWPLSEKDLRDESNYWPIRWLKVLARFPHEYDTWLWWGHSMPNGDPPEPVAPGTRLCGFILASPRTVADGFHELSLPDGRPVQFLSVLPLYREEMQLKLKSGAEALLDRFDAAGIDEVVDVRRRNVAKRSIWPFRGGGLALSWGRCSAAKTEALRGIGPGTEP